MESYKIKSTDKCKPYYRLTIYLWTFQFKPVEAYFPVFTLSHAGGVTPNKFRTKKS